MTDTSAEPFAALVAFDWADQKHAGALQTPDGKSESFELEQSSAPLDRQHQPARPAADDDDGRLFLSVHSFLQEPVQGMNTGCTAFSRPWDVVCRRLRC